MAPAFCFAEQMSRYKDHTNHIWVSIEINIGREACDFDGLEEGNQTDWLGVSLLSFTLVNYKKALVNSPWNVWLARFLQCRGLPILDGWQECAWMDGTFSGFCRAAEVDA